MSRDHSPFTPVSAPARNAFAAAARTALARVANSAHHQNSEREAVPVKSAYLRKPVAIAWKNVMRSAFRVGMVGDQSVAAGAGATRTTTFPRLCPVST